MFPVLFSIGTLQFQTMWFFVPAALFLFLYLVFLQSEDQLLPTAKIFDLLAIGAILGFLIGKILGIIFSLSKIGVLPILTLFNLSAVNFWGVLIGWYGTLFFLSQKLKLPKILLSDIVSLSIIPALAVFYLGVLVSFGISPVAIFRVVWFFAGLAIFWQTAKKIQFSGFYTLITLVLVSTSQLIFSILESVDPELKFINLFISSLILTITAGLFYIQVSKSMKAIGERVLAKIKQKLVKQQKTLESELANLKKDDPLLTEGREISREPGDDAAEFEGHERITVLRQQLKSGLAQVKKALAAIGLGKYGKCERCGKEIGPRRLKIVPSATLCFECEREVEKRGS